MNTELTKEQVSTIIKNTFEKLEKNNKIDIVERKNNLKEEFKRQLSPQKFIKFQNEIDLKLNDTKQNPTLIIVENGALGWANYKHNKMHININSIMENVIQTENEIESIYKKEMKFIEQNVKTKLDMVKWVVAHEFAHTIRYDKVNHTNDFFKTVEKLYQQI